MALPAKPIDNDERILQSLIRTGFSEDVVERPRRLIVSSSGREKTGKCLTGDCTVLLASGATIRVDKLSPGDKISSITPDGHTAFVTVKAVRSDGIQSVQLTTLSDGRYIPTTVEHKFKNKVGWLPAGELHINDRVLVPSHLTTQANHRSSSLDEAAVLGYLTADGGLTCSARFTQGATSVMADFTAHATRCGFFLADYTYNKLTPAIGLSGPLFSQFRSRFDLVPKSADKQFTPEVFLWADALQNILLRAYFTCDGWICNVPSGGLQLGACSASKRLIMQLTGLLLRRGIVVNTRKKIVHGVPYWILEGSTMAAIIFNQAIGFVGENKQKAEKLINELKVTPKRLGYLANYITHGRNEPALGPAAMWAKVKDIRILPVQVPVYDVEIKEELQCFVVNNILVHNSHFALTGPAPIIYLNVDIGTEGVVDKFQNIGKRILLHDVRAPKDNKQAYYVPLWQDLKNKIHMIYTLKKGTVIWDTATEAYEIARMAKFGKLTQVMPHQYTEVNNEWRELLRTAYDSSMNTVFIHKVKPLWLNSVRTKEYELSGFAEMDYLSQINITHYREDTEEGTVYSIYIKDCRQRPGLAGQTISGMPLVYGGERTEDPILNFEMLLSMVHDS